MHGIIIINYFQEDEVLKKQREMIVRPPSARKLDRQRQKRLLEIRMYRELRDVFFMVLFAFLVYYIGLKLHDDHAYRQTQSLREILKISIRPMSKALYKNESVDSFVKVKEGFYYFVFLVSFIVKIVKTYTIRNVYLGGIWSNSFFYYLT